MKEIAGKIIMLFVFLFLATSFFYVEFYVAPLEELANAMGDSLESRDIDAIGKSKAFADFNNLNCEKHNQIVLCKIYSHGNDANMRLYIEIPDSEFAMDSLEGKYCYAGYITAGIKILESNTKLCWANKKNFYLYWRDENRFYRLYVEKTMDFEAAKRYFEKFDANNLQSMKEHLFWPWLGASALKLDAFNLSQFKVLRENKTMVLAYRRLSKAQLSFEENTFEIYASDENADAYKTKEYFNGWTCFEISDSENNARACINEARGIGVKHATSKICKLQSTLNLEKMNCDKRPIENTMLLKGFVDALERGLKAS